MNIPFNGLSCSDSSSLFFTISSINWDFFFSTYWFFFPFLAADYLGAEVLYSFYTASFFSVRCNPIYPVYSEDEISSFDVIPDIWDGFELFLDIRSGFNCS